ncbi:MAG: sulfotransferase [Acidobacteriota bacterium]
MAHRFRQQPIIILGMHRAGTTLLARLLSRLGVFLGSGLEGNHEATYFLNLNNILLERSHANWDEPLPMRQFLFNEELLEMQVRCLKADLESFNARRYLGWWRTLRFRSLQNVDFPWGWKDPRNVFTLPIWLRVFPAAKLVYIFRNGVDVARSLVVREQKYLEWQRARLARVSARGSMDVRLKRFGFRGSRRCLSLHGAFSLWEDYVAQGERLLESLPNDRVRIRYEQLLLEPKHHLDRLARFCGIHSPDWNGLRNTIQQVSLDRANAFNQSEELRDFYCSVANTKWMKQLGYSNLIEPATGATLFESALNDSSPSKRSPHSFSLADG